MMQSLRTAFPIEIDSMQTTTPDTTHLHGDGHTSISSNNSLLVSAKEAVRLFAYKSGIKLVSAAADIETQALEKSIHILSKVSITETAENITLTAKEELSINGGGSFSVFKSGSLTHGTAGVWDMNAATVAMDGPNSLPAVLPKFPQGQCKECMQQAAKQRSGFAATAVG